MNDVGGDCVSGEGLADRRDGSVVVGISVHGLDGSELPCSLLTG